MAFLVLVIDRLAFEEEDEGDLDYGPNALEPKISVGRRYWRARRRRDARATLF
jgi:hypothetical protein